MEPAKGKINRRSQGTINNCQTTMEKSGIKKLISIFDATYTPPRLFAFAESGVYEVRRMPSSKIEKLGIYL